MVMPSPVSPEGELQCVRPGQKRRLYFEESWFSVPGLLVLVKRNPLQQLKREKTPHLGCNTP
jgi:hypothetical protein